MTSYLLFAWASSILSGVTGVTAKLTSKYSIKNHYLFNFLWQLFVVILTVPIALKNGASLPGHWYNIIFASLCSTLFLTLAIRAIYSLEVSVLSPLYSLQTVFSLLLGVVVLHEVIGLRQFLFIALIILGGIFVNYDGHFNWRAFFRKPVLLAVLAMAFLPINSLFINQAIKQDSYWTVVLWTNIFTVLFISLSFPKFKTGLLKVNWLQLSIVLLIAIIQTATSLAYNKAVATNVSITNTINSLPISMIIVFVLSLFFPSLLEKHPVKVYLVRFVCASVMIYSALSLSK
ncbi:EamA family transporter [Candidatus Shapirobacteria bacterium]|nr:EamA family transporter [Candidatus Shapirobacteria bacterium]